MNAPMTLPEHAAHGAVVESLFANAQQVVAIESGSSGFVAGVLRVQKHLDKIAGDLAVAGDLIIDSDDMLHEAEEIAGRLQAVAGDSGEIEKARATVVKPLNDVVRFVNGGFGKPRDDIRAVLQGLKSKMIAYAQEQTRKRERAEAEARRAAEETARATAAAEAEARARAESLMQEAETMRAAGVDASAGVLAQQASLALDEARSASEAAALTAHTAAAAPISAMPKGMRGKWKAVLTSLDILILHVAERLANGDRSLVALLAIDDAQASKLADVQQTGFNIPGLRAEFVPSITIRKGKV